MSSRAGLGVVGAVAVFAGFVLNFLSGDIDSKTIGGLVALIGAVAVLAAPIWSEIDRSRRRAE